MSFIKECSQDESFENSKDQLLETISTRSMLVRQDDIRDDDNTTTSFLQNDTTEGMDGDYTWGGKYLIKEKICLFEKGAKLNVFKTKKGMKKRIGSINKSGLFELYKFDEKTHTNCEAIDKIKSYKKLVLSQYNVEVSRRRKKTGIHITLTDCTSSKRRYEFYVCHLKETWILVFQQHAANCPKSLPPVIPQRLTAKSRGFNDLKDMKRASRISKKDVTVHDFEMECIATEMNVLVPVWEPHHVTLCGNMLTVYKGKDQKSGVLYSKNMKELIVQPDKAQFIIARQNCENETYEYDYPLGLSVSNLPDISSQAVWIKQLSKFMNQVTTSPNLITSTPNLITSSPKLKRNSITNLSPLNTRHSFEHSSPLLKRTSAMRSSAMFDRDSVIRTTMESSVSRSSFNFPEADESLNQTVDSLDNTFESIEVPDNASAGYITPTPPLHDFGDSILSPTGTVNLSDLFGKDHVKSDDDSIEGIQNTNTAHVQEIKPDGEIVADEIMLDEIPIGIPMGGSKTDNVKHWIDKHATAPQDPHFQLMQSEEHVEDYLRMASNEKHSNDSSSSSSSSSGSLDSLVTDKWLGQSLSQSQRVDRDLSFGFHSMAAKKRFSYQSHIQPDRHLSLHYDEYDGLYEEVIEEEFTLATMREEPDESAKQFEYILPKDVSKESILEVFDELLPKNSAPNYVVDFEIVGNVTAEDYEVSTRTQTSMKNGSSVICVVGKPRQDV